MPKRKTKYLSKKKTASKKGENGGGKEEVRVSELNKEGD